MNITVIRLGMVATSTGFVVMCKILTVVVTFFECTRVNSTFLGRNSLPLVLIIVLIMRRYPYLVKRILWKNALCYVSWGWVYSASVLTSFYSSADLRILVTLIFT